MLKRAPETNTGCGAKVAISYEALSILREGREVTLATLCPDEWPQATLINYVNDEEQVYFACAISSQKAQNIKRDDRVSLAFVAPYPAYGRIFGLSLAGHARHMSLVDDVSHILNLWKIRHPYMQAKLRADDRDLAFYAVEPISVTTLYRSGLGYGHQPTDRFE